MIVAAATAAHDELARLAIARRVPALIEKPLASSEEQAAALIATAARRGARVVMAHNSLHAPGLDEFLAVPLEQPSAAYVFRRTPGSPDTMRTWNRSFLYETVYHLLAVVGRACGGGVGEVVKASYRGEAFPEQIRLQLRYGEAAGELTLDFTAAVEEDALARRGGGASGGERVWRRQGRQITISDANGRARGRTAGQRRAAHARQLPRRRSRQGRARRDARRGARRDAHGATRRRGRRPAGAPFERPNAPKHVASRALQQPFQ